MTKLVYRSPSNNIILVVHAYCARLCASCARLRASCGRLRASCARLHASCAFDVLSLLTLIASTFCHYQRFDIPHFVIRSFVRVSSFFLCK